MEIGKRLRLELEKILQRTETKFTLEELARELEKKGRLAPCLYFSGLTSDCMQLGHELDCLNCPDYEPHEPPGPLDEAICEFELGKVYHVMEFAESDGCYRLGRTLCGRFVMRGWMTQTFTIIKPFPREGLAGGAKQGVEIEKLCSATELNCATWSIAIACCFLRSLPVDIKASLASGIVKGLCAVSVLRVGKPTVLDKNGGV